MLKWTVGYSHFSCSKPRTLKVLMAAALSKQNQFSLYKIGKASLYIRRHVRRIVASRLVRGRGTGRTIDVFLNSTRRSGSTIIGLCFSKWRYIISRTSWRKSLKNAHCSCYAIISSGKVAWLSHVSMGNCSPSRSHLRIAIDVPARRTG
jgi:hypothetical protein